MRIALLSAAITLALALPATAQTPSQPTPTVMIPQTAPRAEAAPATN